MIGTNASLKNIHLLVCKLPNLRLWFLSDGFLQILNFILLPCCNFHLVIFESIFPFFGLYFLSFFLRCANADSLLVSSGVH